MKVSARLLSAFCMVMLLMTAFMPLSNISFAKAAKNVYSDRSVSASQTLKQEGTKGFSPRLEGPDASNLYYKHTSYGGYNECILINSTTGSVMPNCVGYAWGRLYEILGRRPNLCKGNGKEWFGYNKSNGFYPYGTVPKLGAIACWSGGTSGYGHVAVVERIVGDTVTTSESGYNGDYFWTKQRSASNSNFSAGSNYTFQGFIYPYDGGDNPVQDWTQDFNPKSNSNITPQTVQAFLESYGGSLKNTTLVNGQTKVISGSSYLDLGFDNYYAHSNTLTEPHLKTKTAAQGLTPAEIIYYACIENDMNIVLMLSKLQQEQSLIGSAATQGKLDCAMGYLKSDHSHYTTGEKFCGFIGQMIAATYQFRTYANSGYSLEGAYSKYSPSSDGNASFDYFKAQFYDPYAARFGSLIGENPQPGVIAAPVITSPTDEYYSGTQGTHYTEGQSISFKWTSVTNASYYLYSVKRLSGAPNPSDDEPANGASFANGVRVNSAQTVTIPSSYLTGGYWYKFAVGAYESESNFTWGRYVYVFIQRSAVTVGTPTITSPTDEYYSNTQGTHYTEGQSISFKWTAVSNASYYLYSVKRLANYPSPSDNEISSGEPFANGVRVNSAQTITIPSSYLTGGYWYKFAVGAYESESNFSWGKYVYIFIPHGAVEVGTPVITSPIDEYYSNTQGTHYTEGQSLTFKWTAATNASYYLYSVKRLSSYPNPSDSEPENGAPYALNKMVYSAQTITIPSSYLTGGSWYKFAVGAYESESNCTWGKYVYVYIKEAPLETVAKPVFSQSTVANGVLLTITCQTAGAKIYYTLDGSTPTTNSAQYNSASGILIQTTTTVKAIAVKSGMTNSDVATTTVTVTPIPTYTVRFIDWNGDILSVQNVKRGESAVAPQAPYRPNYIFKGWDKSFANITSNLDVHALYELDPNATPPENAPIISLSDVTAAAGQTAVVTISLNKNPGICYLRVKLDYDTSALSLQSAANGSVLDSFMNGTNLLWDADSDSYANGVLATLTFAVKDDAPLGSYAISASIKECYNANADDVTIYTSSGHITVSNIMYGDVNGDGKIDGKDVIKLRQYLAAYDDNTGTSSVAVYSGADVNGDGIINGRDLILLRQYLAAYDDDTGTSPVHLGPND